LTLARSDIERGKFMAYINKQNKFTAATLAVFFLAAIAFEAVAEDPLPPLGLPDQGQLRLQMGINVESGPGAIGHVPRRFVHVPTGLQQQIGVRSKCILQFAGPYSLTVLSSTGGNGSGDIGVGPDSLGVPNGPKGVACYRFTANLNEVLEFGLGGDTLDPVLIDANAFWRLELDVEVKKNARLFLDVLIAGSVSATYELRSGSNIDPTDPDASDEPGAAIWNCLASSDSGPDSGENDNCRWIVNEIGTSFRIRPGSGEGSWEGGGDFVGNAYANNSVIYLTKGDIGVLGCETGSAPGGTDTSTIGDGINDAQCQVTRLDPSLSTGGETTCEANVGYVFRNLSDGLEGCELLKNPGEQLAASVDICFPPEDSQLLGFDSPKTQVQFTNPLDPENPFDFTPERCDGTIDQDSNGNRIMTEVLNSPGTYDLIDVPGQTYPDDKVEYACVLDNAEEYQGPIAMPKMQVCQTILFWGDIRWNR
jgi:hypothetical protein